MGRLLSDAFELVLMFLVPAVVWATLTAGLFQLVREEVRQIRVTPRRSKSLERYSQQAG